MDQKPRKTRKAGYRKVTSEGMSDKQLEISSKEFELLNRIQTAREAGDVKEALRQMDLLIAYVETAGRPSFEYQVDKLLMIDPENLVQLIPIYENQLNYYSDRKDLLGQLDSLISLSAVCINSGRIEQAKKYIDSAESVFPSVQNAMNNIDSNTSIMGINRIEAKLEQVQNAKKYIDELLNSDR